MPTFPELFVIFILGIWLIATALYMLFNKKLGIYSQKLDPFKWISSYQLFTDPPKTFLLFYRERRSTNELTEWKLVPIIVEFRWYHALWFPEALVFKNIQYIISQLVILTELHSTEINRYNISERFIYKTILQFIWRIFPGSNAVEMQFKIDELKRSPVGNSTREVFISFFHKK